MMDIIKNDIRAAMDRAVQERLSQIEKGIMQACSESLNKPIIIDRVRDDLHEVTQYRPSFKMTYCRCNNCGRFARANGCVSCGTSDIKLHYTVQVPVPVENIDLNFVI